MINLQTVLLAETLETLSPERRAEIESAIRAAVRADRFDRFAAGARASVRRHMARQARQAAS